MSDTMETRRGILYVVGTPIGNLSDLSDRARETLSTVSRVAAEDTRRTLTLCRHLNISPGLVSLHQHNEGKRVSALVADLLEGEDLALVSDAGLPAISDPGQILIRGAIDAGVEVVPIPGPSAVLTALVASGLPTDRFTFVGFPPPKSGRRKRFLSGLVSMEETLILFEGWSRIRALLQDIQEVLGARQVVVARELTKRFESFLRGTPEELLQCFEPQGQEPLKGEFTLVIAGAPAGRQIIASEDLVAEASGARGMKALAAVVAKATGASKRDAYQALLSLKSEEE